MNDGAARVFVPLALLAVAIFLWVGFQTTQLIREREGLQTLRQGQEAQVQSSQKLRASLDAIASGTAKLAEQGNPSARLIVDELRKRGVTIKPNAPATPGK
jgi:hypothetical protein